MCWTSRLPLFSFPPVWITVGGDATFPALFSSNPHCAGPEHQGSIWPPSRYSKPISMSAVANREANLWCYTHSQSLSLRTQYLIYTNMWWCVGYLSNEPLQHSSNSRQYIDGGKTETDYGTELIWVLTPRVTFETGEAPEVNMNSLIFGHTPWLISCLSLSKTLNNFFSITAFQNHTFF